MNDQEILEHMIKHKRKVRTRLQNDLEMFKAQITKTEEAIEHNQHEITLLMSFRYRV